MLPFLVYVGCALTSILCALLLYRSYRTHRVRLLFWSCLCFCGLALNNVVLFIDLVVVPTADLGMARNAAALAAMLCLLVGLLWDAE